MLLEELNNILVSIQEGQRPLEQPSLVGGGEIEDFGTKVLVIQTVVEISSGKALCMSLQSVDLLNLAAIWKANILNTKVVLGIVSVGRDLTWVKYQ